MMTPSEGLAMGKLLKSAGVPMDIGALWSTPNSWDAEVKSIPSHEPGDLIYAAMAYKMSLGK